MSTDDQYVILWKVHRVDCPQVTGAATWNARGRGVPVRILNEAQAVHALRNHRKDPRCDRCCPDLDRWAS